METSEGLQQCDDDLVEQYKAEEEDRVQIADDIISASLDSGALLDVCEITASTRLIDDHEEDLLTEAASATKDQTSHPAVCSFLQNIIVLLEWHLLS